jgi:hypothetical protein
MKKIARPIGDGEWRIAALLVEANAEIGTLSSRMEVVRKRVGDGLRELGIPADATEISVVPSTGTIQYMLSGERDGGETPKASEVE